MTLSHVRIVGSGLIGTSIGLGLVQHGIKVSMHDRDPKAELLARDLISPPSSGPVDFVILATPISALPALLDSEYNANPNSAFIDVSSVKSKVKVDVSASKLPLTRFLPTHPMAGREVGGAESARADLFQGRVWIIDSRGVDSDVTSNACELIQLLGAHVVDLDSEEHDRAVGLVSHLPQIIASLLAKQLHGAGEGWLDLAGAGLRDTTRIAASDAGLWREIISANSKALKPLLEIVRNDLNEVIAGIENQDVMGKLIEDGNVGRSRIPGKHGGKAREYTYLPVVIEDKPGQLAALFDECAIAGVNVEDLSIEHSPGQFTGLITLALSAIDAEKLRGHLKNKGWSVHSSRS